MSNTSVSNTSVSDTSVSDTCVSSTGKYKKIIDKLNSALFDELKNNINKTLSPLINEINNDIDIIDNYNTNSNMINQVIKQFPIYKHLEDKYREIMEENIVLKEKNNSIEQTNIKLCIMDNKNDSIRDNKNDTTDDTLFTSQNIKLEQSEQSEQSEQRDEISTYNVAYY